MTTPSELAEFLEALSDNATGGPWMIDQDRADGFAPWVKAPNPDYHEPFWVCGLAAMGGDEEQNNAALIIGLRNNLPTILSALRRVEKMEGALRLIIEISNEDQRHEPQDDFDLGSRAARSEAADIARQALTGEA